MKKVLLGGLLLFSTLFIGEQLNAQTIDTAIASGNWFSGSTWKSGTVPADGDNVVILSGVTVNTLGIDFEYFTVNIPQMAVYGTLQLGDPTKDFPFSFKYQVTIDVKPGGVLQDTTGQDQFHGNLHDLLFPGDDANTSIIVLRDTSGTDSAGAFVTKGPSYIYASNAAGTLYDDGTPFGSPAPADTVTGPLTITISDFTVLAVPVVTGVHLTNFTGRYNPSGNVALTWKTASEQNNAYFEIQRSEDGHNFIALDKVPGSGTTSVAHQYNYMDYGVNKTAANTLFYRLRQVDIDGKFHFSNMIKIDINNPLVSLKLWPNPNNGQFRLSLGEVPARPVVMSIINISGQVIKQEKIQQYEVPVDLSRNTKGIYFIKLNYENGRNEILKAVVQ